MYLYGPFIPFVYELRLMRPVIVAAIANYTVRVVDPSLDSEQIQEALKFIGTSPLGSTQSLR